jgi:voltage-gated potassium channel
VFSAADWVVWTVFAADVIVSVAVAPDRVRWLREHPLDVVIVVLTPPFLSVAFQSLRVLQVLRLLRLFRVGPLVRRVFSLEGLRYAAVISLLVGLLETFDRK